MKVKDMKPYKHDDANYWNGDDLGSALHHNAVTQFNVADITHIAAEVCGENDGADWWWVLRLNDGRFFLLSGGCDYTGWDCRSSVAEHGFFKTALQAAKAAPEKDQYYNRCIRKNLVGQVRGTQPLFTYIEEAPKREGEI